MSDVDDATLLLCELGSDSTGRSCISELNSFAWVQPGTVPADKFSLKRPNEIILVLDQHGRLQAVVLSALSPGVVKSA